MGIIYCVCLPLPSPKPGHFSILIVDLFSLYNTVFSFLMQHSLSFGADIKKKKKEILSLYIAYITRTDPL